MKHLAANIFGAILVYLFNEKFCNYAKLSRQSKRSYPSKDS